MHIVHWDIDWVNTAKIHTKHKTLTAVHITSSLDHLVLGKILLELLTSNPLSDLKLAERSLTLRNKKVDRYLVVNYLTHLSHYVDMRLIATGSVFLQRARYNVTYQDLRGLLIFCRKSVN